MKGSYSLIMKKTLMIIGGFIVGIVILAVIIVFAISATSQKMICKSEEGNITIMYNEKTLKGYTAKGISYDFDGQKEYAEEIGIEPYLVEFESWFKNNTNGDCSR